jgi:hypothetical protein
MKTKPKVEAEESDNKFRTVVKRLLDTPPMHKVATKPKIGKIKPTNKAS